MQTPESPLEVLIRLASDRGEGLEHYTLAGLTTAYLEWMGRELPADAEFAYVAATLIQWKSRRLLRDPANDVGDAGEVAELIETLRQDDARKGAEALRTRLEKTQGGYWRQVTSEGEWRSVDTSPTVAELTTEVEAATVAELINTLEQALAVASVAPIEVEREKVTSELVLAWLRGRLRVGARVSVEELVAEQQLEPVGILMGLLELVKTGEARLEQQVPFGVCWAIVT